MTKKINRMIEDNRPLSAIQSEVKAELLRQDKASWMSEKQSEYNLLFPIYEDELVNITIDELELNPIKYLMTGSNSGDFTDETKTYECKVIIDYSTDENYLTFTDWLNETIVITEAVEATYDEDGRVLTEAVAEVVELVREFVAPEVTEDMLDAYLNTNDGYLKYLKSESNKIIESMTVTISSGKEFDANELARVNMMSAVISSEFAGLTETSWRLANNETTVVTLNELKEAVMLALVKFGQLKGIV